MKFKNMLLCSLTAIMLTTSCSDLNLDAYTVVYVSYNGNILYTDFVEYGNNSTYQGKTPTKPADDDNSYEFKGWSEPIINIEENKVVTAEYYTLATVTFKNYDDSVLDTTTVKQGETAKFSSKNPIKLSDNNSIAYKFIGWDKSLENVQKNFETTAQYRESDAKLIIFNNYNGTELERDYEPVGEMPTYNGTTPTRIGSLGETYTFTGWSPELMMVTSDQTYTAQYHDDTDMSEATINYKINYDGESYYVDSFNDDGRIIRVPETYNDGINGEHPVVHVFMRNIDNYNARKQILYLPKTILFCANNFHSNILAIYIDEANERYTSVDGILYSKDLKTICAYPAGITGEYTINDSVTEISDSCFTSSSLSSIKIGKNIKSFTGNAFVKSPYLAKFEVDSENANFCSIDGVVYNKAKTKIIYYPQNRNGTDYMLSDDVTEIGAFSFAFAMNLKNLILSKNLEVIGRNAFSNMSLNSFCIPAKLKEIGLYAFSSLNLDNFTIEDGNQYFSVEDGILYNYAKTTLICAPINNTIVTYNIPDTVEEIGNGAICLRKVNTINIPNSVKAIHLAGFNYVSINSLYIPNTVETIDEYGIDGLETGAVISCGATSKPSGWDDKWNGNNYTVKWGVANPNA